MYMIVGLGNPGREYAQTRHNMGFLTLEVLAARWQIPVAFKGFQGLYGKGLAEGQKVMLVAPQTYMNASGECVGAMARFFDVPIDHILVIYDDIDLPVGRLRVRQAGSAGTHNGMKSLVTHLGGGGFPRIRVGVGKPEPGVSLVDYVLGVPPKTERATLEQAMQAAADAAAAIIRGGMDEAMRFANTFQG